MKIKRTKDDVILCGLLVSEGYGVCQVESMINIPKSTVHWVIHHRLRRFDNNLYIKCIHILYAHKHGKELRHDRSTSTTKSN